jgi:hypothetical protein
MMSEVSPRHSIKARRKQKEDTGDFPIIDTMHNDDNKLQDCDEQEDDNNGGNNDGINASWRSKYEAAVRKRRSPISNNFGHDSWGVNNDLRKTNLSPLSNKSSAINSITSASQADMEFILATSMDTMDQQYGTNSIEPILVDGCSPKSTYSADSIIRRVEAEIAAARKSAALAKHNQYYQSNQQQQSNSSTPYHINHNNDDDDDDDMAHILNTTNTFSEHAPTNGTISPSIASTDDSSKRRAMDLIHDEFRSAENDVEPAHPATVAVVSSNDDMWHDASTGCMTATSNFFLENLRQTTEELVRAEDIIFHPAEEKKVEGNNDIYFNQISEFKDDVTSKEIINRSNKGFDNTPIEKKNQFLPNNESGTPTRSNSHRYVIDMESKSINQSNTNSMDPDGDYVETTTPPRKMMTEQQQLEKGIDSIALSSSQLHPIVTTSRPIQQHRSSPMDKTRELLDSLKEQRQSIPKTPSIQQQRTNSPRSPIIDLNSRYIKGIIPTTNLSSSNENRQLGDMTSVDRYPLPPSPSLSRNHDVQITQRPIFPDEVYELAKQSTAEKNNSDTACVTSADQSRRIRFRNPFPLLKPPKVRRSLEEIIHDHAMDIPDIPVRWVKPKYELKQLIVAAMGTSLPRRSNACGALKVLTRQERNQLSLVRTDGFLQAIAYAASQSVLDVDTDLAIDARTRAVTCFKNVCHPKDNRIVILNHPGVIECLLKVVQQDDGEGRATAAAAIALLAKTPHCRECLVQIDGLIDTLAKVMHSAATMISDEAMAVRQSFSPRSGSNNSYIQHHSNKITATAMITDEVNTTMDSSVLPNEMIHNGDDKLLNETESIESSSLSSADGTGGNESIKDSLSKAIGEMITMIGSKLLDVRSVDSIRNQTDERYEEFVNQARCNACAALLHISKQCATSVSTV